ncbi:SagB/ThcOx family dehydrogenase [Bifidobacterium pullorum subsp. gallinarum]
MINNREEYIYTFFHKNSYNYPSQIKYASGERFKTNNSLSMASHSYDILPESCYKFDGVNRCRSSRDFICEPMSQKALFTILHSSYLIETDSNGIKKSTTPSAGGIFPVEIFLLINRVEGVIPGIFHYHRELGKLSFINQPTKREIVVPINKRLLISSAAQIIFTINVENLVKKYGSRGYRYALIECGHIGQNISIVCESLAIGCCPIGGFYDRDISSILNLNKSYLPIYMYAIGRVGNV